MNKLPTFLAEEISVFKNHLKWLIRSNLSKTFHGTWKNLWKNLWKVSTLGKRLKVQFLEFSVILKNHGG